MPYKGADDVVESVEIDAVMNCLAILCASLRSDHGKLLPNGRSRPCMANGTRRVAAMDTKEAAGHTLPVSSSWR